MKVYSYSQARQKLTEVLNRSRSEPLAIRRRGGETFRVSPQQFQGSPLDVRGVRTGATTSDIVRINSRKPARDGAARRFNDQKSLIADQMQDIQYAQYFAGQVTPPVTEGTDQY